MILFMGAGASRPFEIPTTHEFITPIEEEVKQRENLADFYHEIKIEYTEPFDLEILLTVLDDLRKGKTELLRSASPYTTQVLLSKPKILEFKNREKIAEDLFSLVKNVIREECTKPIKDKMERIIDTYDAFFKMLDSVRTRLRGSSTWNWGIHNSGDRKIHYPTNLRIFTTNYDTCAEAYLNKRRIDFIKGVKERHGNYIFDTSSYNDKDTLVELFKLHGSIDLFRTQNGNIIHHTALGREDTTSLGEKIEEEVIMYPVEASGYALSSQSPFLDLFRIFRDKISRDNIWIIIGFSFRDKTITSIFNDVLRTREDRERVKVVFIDPLSEKIKEKLREDGFHYLGEKIETSKFKFVEEDLSGDFDRLFEIVPPPMAVSIQ